MYTRRLWNQINKNRIPNQIFQAKRETRSKIPLRSNIPILLSCIGSSLITGFVMKFLFVQENENNIENSANPLQYVRNEFTNNFFNYSKGNKSPVSTSISIDTEEIGGYKKEIDQLMREVFYSRSIGPYAEAYGILPAKGIVLYGPPGTGKTQIARAVSKSFENVEVIRGPALKNEKVGKSERMLRELFAPAIRDWNQYGAKSPIYVYIFDEIDALFPKRSADISNGLVRSDNSMTSQFLTILDGVNSPRNIIVIGTTNYLEALDPALLRPGRLEVHIEVKLPREEERLEILRLKTKKMHNNNLLDSDVDLNFWAKQSDGFTGAELEFLVKKSAQYAMEANLDENSSGSISLKREITCVEQLKKVNQNHFVIAFDQMQHTKANEIVEYSEMQPKFK